MAASAPSINGAPVTPRVNPTPSKRLSSFSANRRAIASCDAVRMLTAISSCSRSTGCSVASCAIETSTRGGSRLTEQNALAVIPWSTPSVSRAVTMVTPETKRPSTLRKVALSIGMRSALVRGDGWGFSARGEGWDKQRQEIRWAQYLPGRNKVTGDADEQVRQILAARKRVSGALDERRKRHRGSDETFHAPLAGELRPALALILAKRIVIARPLERCDSRVRGELAPAQRGVYPLASERVEKI